MIGNFYGDFTRNSEFPKFREGVVEGVILHRHIDQYTDDHNAFRDSLALLRIEMGRYASVALDVINDYLLVEHWEDYANVSLRQFCDDFYALITSKGHPYPSKLQRQLPLMIDHDFLMSTSTRKRLMRSLQHLDRRARFESEFTKAHDILFHHYDLFEKSFQELMPDLVAHYEYVAKDFSR